MSKQPVLMAAALFSAFLALPANAQDLSAEEARAIARDAYVYGYPLVDHYRIQYAYFVDRESPEYKAPWNQLNNTARVYTPADKAIQTPNSDTPYSQLGADLRAEPLVLSMPAVAKDRYYSVQFVDAYTHNFAYVGSRATGNEAGNFLLAGPDWKGATPPGIKSVIRSETQFAFLLYRTQLFGPEDLDEVKKVQAGYKVQPLSTFLGQPAPAAAPEVDFIRPLSVEDERKSVEFFEVLNFVLRFCPTHPSEKALMERFAKLGIGPGGSFDAASLSPELRQAVQAGIGDAWSQSYAGFERLRDARKVGSADVFGTREHLAGNYLYRMGGAVGGIYGNSAEEALYPSYFLDSTGQKLDAAKHRYALRFSAGQLPPVKAFWSLTAYSLPSRLLVENPLNRYLINSPMLPSLKRDADGGVTLYVQHERPSADRESNWLPVPAGPFFLAMRLYWPEPAASNGTWKRPELVRVD
ncbi:cell envelope protein [Pseudomonas taiwanensis]|uniref:DUF1254 domain-containing protein n=1 Tax=Pseudomonas taiwanensis TaxID=470150 RepID=UPI0015BCD5F2|nr:DUF1254 domain-containing protein [Pseudomonas taiwanensis]NWL81138.1 cell envelope protein [Pseudomonas taiwanensis]